MRLSIGHDPADRETAGKIAALCVELGIEPFLDERNDWLMNGLRPGGEGVTHGLVILSAANRDSWWVPFHLGRAAEEGIPLLLYRDRTYPSRRTAFPATPTARGLSELRDRLRSWRDGPSSSLRPGPVPG